MKKDDQSPTRDPDPTMSPDKAVNELQHMKTEQDSGSYFDQKEQHERGDEILCAVLRHLGHPEVSDAWEAASLRWWWD